VQPSVLGAQISDYERHSTEQESPPATTIYVGVDGTGVAIIPSQIQGRRGKQCDGSAKTMEMKIVAVWVCDRVDEQGYVLTDPMSVTNSAAIESAITADRAKELCAFATRIEREALRRGFLRCKSSGCHW